MPPVAAPVWWEDVQQEREDFAGRARRPVDEWLDEDVDFAPRRRLPRRSADEAVVLEFDLDAALAEAAYDDEPAMDSAPMDSAPVDEALHGAFLHAESAPGGGVPAEPGSGRRSRPEPSGGTLGDQRFLAPPPPDGERRTVQITGRPEAARAPLPSRRHRPRTTADRVGPRPDKLALYAVMLGIVLILIALSSASPS
jgi:hypothetical protein